MTAPYLQIEQLLNKLKQIREIEVPRAMNAALNRTLQRTLTETARELAQQTHFPVRVMRQRLKPKRSTVNSLTARIYGFQRPVNAFRLTRVRDTGYYRKGQRGRQGQGVKAKGDEFPESFLITGKSAIFTRTAGKLGQKKQPLSAEYIEIQNQMQAALPSAAARNLSQHYPARLSQELAFRLNKYQV